jgi:SAM-dependent methyltransferase
LNPAVLSAAQERQRATAALLVKLGYVDLSDVRLLEVGCGTGRNLLEFLRLGVAPEHLLGIELLKPSADEARRVLPESVRIIVGDAAGTAGSAIPATSYDVVFQATVFSSLLNESFQERLANVMWQWVRPGGGVLWYDFTYDNPVNPDVRGIPLSRIRHLFPRGRMLVRRVTLAPPVARFITRLHPGLYSVFNTCRWLRTHVLVWIEKSKTDNAIELAATDPCLGDKLSE